MKQRQLMAVRIQRAKLRISLKSNAGRSGGDESVDAKDELVEALLRGGVADEDIYNYKMKRDYSLQWPMAPTTASTIDTMARKRRRTTSLATDTHPTADETDASRPVCSPASSGALHLARLLESRRDLLLSAITHLITDSNVFPMTYAPSEDNKPQDTTIATVSTASMIDFVTMGELAAMAVSTRFSDPESVADMPVHQLSSPTCSIDLADLFNAQVSNLSSAHPVVLDISGHKYFIAERSLFVMSDFAFLPTFCRALLNHPLRFSLVLMDPPWENKSVKRSQSYSSMDCRLLSKIHLLNHKPKGTIPISQEPNSSQPLLDVDADTNTMPPLTSKVIVSVPSRHHSQKPFVHDLLEKYAPRGDTGRLELFARNLFPRWHSWGNDVLKFNKQE
ncbi:hypothetical protein BASA83_012410 [Batrachochytrium salamandrivorans]|nr:hypothetical protein BASA83_012410 [Batrachochytrium salamandrivorans]